MSSGFSIVRGARVLAVGAHFDDVAIACGGLVMKLACEYQCRVTLAVCANSDLVYSSADEEAMCARQEALLSLENTIRFGFPDGSLTHSRPLIDAIERAVQAVNADLVLSHSPSDYHQDHVAVSQSTLASLRRFDGTLVHFAPYTNLVPFEPNLRVDISAYLDRKVELVRALSKDRSCAYSQEAALRVKDAEVNDAGRIRHSERFRLVMMRV